MTTECFSLAGRDRIKVLFARPPYHVWPILNESDQFLLPLAFPCLSGYLKSRTRGIEIKVLDCLPLQKGWKSFRRYLEAERPDVLAVGDKCVYVHEGMKAVAMAKEMNPGVVTIAGGHFHSHSAEYSLNRNPALDIVVRYEGEETMRQLLETLRDGGDLSGVRSIAYRSNGGVTQTPPRPIIDNLDDLPFPDYDALPVDRYSPFGWLNPRAITIQKSRGCPYDCGFCCWSAMENEHTLQPDGKVTTSPAYRQKSVERSLAEVDYVTGKYDASYLYWVDGTWNHDDEWINEWCDGIIRRGYKLHWWAFVRPDLLVKQHQNGTLKKMVRAGFTHALIGGERCADDDLGIIGKKEYSQDNFQRAVHLMEEHYPEVFRQATMIVGLPNETRESLLKLGKYARDAHLDFAAFHSFTPYPGTKVWDNARNNGWLDEDDFSKFDLFHPVVKSPHISREEVSKIQSELHRDFVMKQPLRYLRGMTSRHWFRRRIHWWFFFAIGRVLTRDFLLALVGKKKFEGFGAITALWKPSWYDS
jgi:anaerobic magnesium-protoporphyrin IX monomethyl ester cyclase